MMIFFNYYYCYMRISEILNLLRDIESKKIKYNNKKKRFIAYTIII